MRRPALSSVLPPLCPSYPCSSSVSPAVTSASVKSTSADSASVRPCSFTSSLRLRATLSCRPLAPPPALPATATSVLRLQAVPHPLRLSHCIEISESPARSRDHAKIVGRSSKAMHSLTPSPIKKGDTSNDNDWRVSYMRFYIFANS